MFGPNDAANASISEIEWLVSPVTQRRGDSVEKGWQPGSNQIEPREGLSGDQIVEPPIDLRLWASQLARATRLARGIRVIARNTVGLGWTVVPGQQITRDTTDREKAQIQAEILRVKAFFEDINPTVPFNALMECVVTDEEATGNGYVEFVRDGAGKVKSAFHVMSTTVRILRNYRGFVQIREVGRRYFKRFGDDRVMDARNGAFAGEPGFNRGVEGPLPIEHRASEIMHFLLYSPTSEYYGVPRFVPAGAAIAGNFHAAKRNVSLMKHDSVPRMAVLVTGGVLDDKSRDQISNLFREGQGPDQHGRLIVLQATREGIGVDDKNTATLELQPLTVGKNEDGSFLNYRRMNDEEIREALGLSEVYFKSEKLTKASAVVAKATTDEQEFGPARALKEHTINKLIVRKELKATKVLFRFVRPETSDPTERAVVHRSYSLSGVLSPNEIRADLGREPFPKTEEWAQVPLPIALLAAEGRLTNASELAVEPEGEDAEAPPVNEEPDGAEGSEEPADDQDEEEGGDETAETPPTNATAVFDEAVKVAVNRVRSLPSELRLGKT